MASCLSPVTALYNYRPNTALKNSTLPGSPFLTCSHHSINHILSLIHRRFSVPYAWSGTSRATTPAPPSPPDSDPPTGQSPSPLSGLPMTLSRFKDTVQIFFAVLFWMGLFFWASVWDGRNNGRPDKGSRFRR